jgi:hypothetical protein
MATHVDGLASVPCPYFQARGLDLSRVRTCVVVAEERPRIALTQSFSKLFKDLGLHPRAVSTSFGCRVNLAICLQVSFTETMECCIRRLSLSAGWQRRPAQRIFLGRCLLTLDKSLVITQMWVLHRFLLCFYLETSFLAIIHITYCILEYFNFGKREALGQTGLSDLFQN